MPRLPDDKYEERVVLSFDHAEVTATTSWKFWKCPVGKAFKLDRALYLNPTGLAEHATAVFDGAVRNASLTNIDFTGEADNDTATATAHGLVTGAGPYHLTNAGGGLPGGLSILTNYWIIRTGADTFKFASSYANALAETAVALSSDGTGTHTLVIDVMSRLFNTDSNLNPDVGASLEADTFVTGSATGTSWLSANNELVLTVTEGGTATLPAGRLVIEGRLY